MFCEEQAQGFAEHTGHGTAKAATLHQLHAGSSRRHQTMVKTDLSEFVDQNRGVGA